MRGEPVSSPTVGLPSAVSTTTGSAKVRRTSTVSPGSQPPSPPGASATVTPVTPGAEP